MVEAKEQVVDHSLEPGDKPVAQLEYLGETDLPLPVENRAELDVLSDFSRDFGLAENGKALEASSDVLSDQEKAARYVEGCLANEIYLQAIDQLSAGEANKKIVLVNVTPCSKGNPTALAELEAPSVPRLESAYKDMIADPEQASALIKQGYNNFIEKMTGARFEDLDKKGHELLRRLRWVQPKSNGVPEILRDVVSKRTRLDNDLENLLATPYLQTKYSGILVPKSGLKREIIFDLSKDRGTELTIGEYSAKLDEIEKSVIDLERASDEIPVEVKEDVKPEVLEARRVSKKNVQKPSANRSILGSIRQAFQKFIAGEPKEK